MHGVHAAFGSLAWAGCIEMSHACHLRSCPRSIYQNMSETVLQGLRRRLPVTRTKFDWDKLSVSRLASEVAALGTK